MKTRFFNGTVVTMDEQNSIFQGEVHTCDDKITHVGGALADVAFDREVDLRGGVIMPGFKDAHCHSPMTLFRNYADDLPLNDWLFKRIFPLEDKLTGDDVYWGTMLAVTEYLAGGITAVCDMYFLDDYLCGAMADSGMRCVFVKAMSDLGKDAQAVLQQGEDSFNRLNGLSPLVRCDLGVHAEYTASRELLKGAALLSKKYNAPVSLHLSESKEEVLQTCIEHGKRPPAEVASYGVFDNGGMAYHCVHLNDSEMDLLEQKGVSVVANPASNLKLANGIAQIDRMQLHGLNVALGTDGPASNNKLDMFREMYLACALQKYLLADPSAMPAEEVLKMATVNGAKAMRLDDCDCIAVGKQADLVVLDLNKPNTRPFANLQKSIVYSADKTNVRMTVVAGKILYEDGIYHIGTDVEEIYSRCEKAVKRLVE